MAADAQFWNDLAEEYAAKPVDNPESFERKIAITQALIEPDDVVLNIGCGTGSLALRLAGRAREVHGLDVSPAMVRIASNKVHKQAVENVRFHVSAFAGELPFAPESLDGICAYSILHLLEDRDAALARIFSLLKPGGFFVSSTVVLGDSWVPYRPLLTVMQWLGKAPYVAIIKRTQLLEELQQHGFVDLETPEVGASATVLFLVARKP